jgi:hypothetical protein
VDQHPETQGLELRRFAAERGYQIVQEYVDHGVSGTKVRRPALDQLLKDAHRRGFDAVIVWSCDRLARSTKHFLQVLDELNELGIQFLSQRETIDTDGPLVLTELIRREEGSARNAFAASALRIGVLAMRQAQGHVDAEIVRTEGQRLISELNHELATGIREIDSKIASNLKLYFDPQSGHFTERVERLVRKDGDLERVLRQQIGDGESSELARALARRIGENSPLMRRLDPQHADSINRSIETSVREVLDGEQDRILSEFSMDNENGALTRVLTQLRTANELFTGDIGKQIQDAVREFSLDDETSALSRLVKKVEQAKDQITNEFSLDNAGSAINKLNLVLAETKRSINDNLTLDNDQSALARLKNQLTTVLNVFSWY